MTIQERCKTAEAKLEEISTALLDYRPETLDRCEAELHEIAGLLDCESLELSERPVPSDRPALLGLRKRSALLGLQIQQAANLCQGWAQLRLSEGYTNQGRPVLPPSAPQASYEV
jgi:hypothetical protein